MADIKRHVTEALTGMTFAKSTFVTNEEVSL
jgi:hypothetical protein